MVGAEGLNQGVGVKLYRVGAFVADGQEGVALPDVGEGGGHGWHSILVQTQFFLSLHSEI